MVQDDRPVLRRRRPDALAGILPVADRRAVRAVQGRPSQREVRLLSPHPRSRMSMQAARTRFQPDTVKRSRFAEVTMMTYGKGSQSRLWFPMILMVRRELRDIVYALTNGAMPGLIKIGRTSRDYAARTAELYTTGVPQPFDVALAYRVENGPLIERALHIAFAPYRHTARREFFRVEPFQVEAILDVLGEDAQAEEVTSLVSSSPELIPNEHIRRRPRPAADFLHMGLRLGDAIQFRRAEAIATIAGRRVVEYEGSITSLTAATRQLLPTIRFGNAYELWMYNGEPLMRIYNRVYPRPTEDRA